jgi:hypothetical protein
MHIITLTLKLDPYSVWHALDAQCPDSLVELGVEADVLRAHRLLSEVNYRLDSMGGPLLEGAAVHTFVQVNGVFAGDNVLKGRACLAGLIDIAETDGRSSFMSLGISRELLQYNAPFWWRSWGPMQTASVKGAASTTALAYHFLEMSGSMSSEGVVCYRPKAFLGLRALSARV